MRYEGEPFANSVQDHLHCNCRHDETFDERADDLELVPDFGYPQ